MLKQIYRTDNKSIHCQNLSQIESSTQTNESLGSDDFHLLRALKVHVQVFRWLPTAISVEDSHGQEMRSLPYRFQKMMKRAVEHLSFDFEDVASERSWVFYGYRHGTLSEVCDLVVDEIVSGISDEDLEGWFVGAIQGKEVDKPKASLSPIGLILSRLQQGIDRNSDSVSFSFFKESLKPAFGQSTSSFLSDWESPSENKPFERSTSKGKLAFTFRSGVNDGSNAMAASNNKLGFAIDAMSNHNPKERRRAVLYFSEQCNKQTDRFVPLWKARTGK